VAIVRRRRRRVENPALWLVAVTPSFSTAVARYVRLVS
jgi:hypothetical protein